MSFRIRTLHLADLMVPWAHATVKEPIHCWLVTDGSRHILVDSGLPTPEDMQRRLNVESKGGGPQALVDALAGAGARPAEIGTVVLTHLHFDHAWNLELFPEAQLVVQRDELMHAIDPVPTQRLYYLRETIATVLARKRPKGLLLVDGDAELFPGFELVKVPGHTPGMQAAIVSTEKGRAALVSDCGDNYANWFPADPASNPHPVRYLTGDFMPGQIRSEGELTYAASMRRVLARADVVVPAHDTRIPRAMPEEWFAKPQAAAPA